MASMARAAVTVKQFNERAMEGPVPARRPDLGPCLLWTGPQLGGKLGDRYGGFGRGYAHRWSYTYFVGPIPDGHEVDHLCRVKLCVRPSHLEPVTPEENMRRTQREECPQGHPYAEHGVEWGGQLYCQPCNQAKKNAQYRAQNGGHIGPTNEAKTHCPQNHPYSGPNLRIDTKGARRCRVCDSIANRKQRERRKALRS